MHIVSKLLQETILTLVYQQLNCNYNSNAVLVAFCCLVRITGTICDIIATLLSVLLLFDV